MILLVVVSSGACGPEPIVARPEGSKPTPARPVGSPDGGSLRVHPTGAQTPTPAREVPTLDGGTRPALPSGACTTVDAAAPREDVPSLDGATATAADAGARPPRAGDIAIVEVLVNPTGQDVGREWIEIVSLAAEPLDLSALHIADAAADVAAPVALVVPGGRVVIGQSTDAATNGGAPVSVAYGTRLVLNNDGEELLLCLGPCADGVVLERATWAELGAAYDGHALVLDRAAVTTCPAEQPFGTAGDFGTPGEPNGSCARPDGGI
jgi:hypothetical protein